MPIHYVRQLTARQRTVQANEHLGVALAFVAGGINAGGFLAVRQYTSHMTGIVSEMADNIVLGYPGMVLAGVGALLSFIAGAALTAVLVNHARRRSWHSEYAGPLMIEALLLIGFGVMGARLAEFDGLFVPATVMLLCALMGIQNALITKISRAEIRTTHVTGIVTDIGIELGKLFYWNLDNGPDRPRVVADRARLRLLSLLLLAFFGGGVVGAVGFSELGYLFSLPLALVLLFLAVLPTLDDLKRIAGR